jgi:hypothetical protein
MPSQVAEKPLQPARPGGHDVQSCRFSHIKVGFKPLRFVLDSPALEVFDTVEQFI